jgi:hypothetical protein
MEDVIGNGFRCMLISVSEMVLLSDPCDTSVFVESVSALVLI